MASRIPSVSSFRLPAIQHPLSRLGDPETISLRGFSTDGARNPDPLLEQRKRPLSLDEHSRSVFRRYTSKSNKPDRDPWMESGILIRHPQQIPEGVEVRQASDPEKPTLPIFGQRMHTGSVMTPSSSVISSASTPGARLSVQVDQLEQELREKMDIRGNFILKRLFKNNNPDGLGQVNRDVLLVILIKFLGRFISARRFRQLLSRLHLLEKSVITFEELCAALREPVSARSEARLTASQVHSLLLGPAQNRFLDIMESCLERSPTGPAWMESPKLRKALQRLNLHMEDEEFEKLWKRYNKDGLDAVRFDLFLKNLGVKARKEPNSCENKSVQVSDIPDRVRALSKAEEERHASIAMETWLKDKFREGFQKMKTEFVKLDPEKSGKVQPDEFLQVLRKFGLHLRREYLYLFLARCGLEPRNGRIHYLEFLRRFQDRGEEGVTHRILANPKHRFHQDENITHSSSVTAVEAKLALLFQSEYLALLDTFQKIDSANKRAVSQQEFRAAIESRFRLEMTDPQFEQLLDRLPLDQDGNVQYPLFMAAFDSRGGAPSLFGMRSSGDGGPINRDLEEGRDAEAAERRELGTDRNDAQLFRIIKTLIKKEFQAVQRAFEQLDERNTRRLTQEVMHQLLKRFDIHPEVSRGEIRRLWGTLITNQDKTLDFLQFVRHFGFSPKSACFPSAKICPPKKGDENFRQHSKKLNCVSDILVDSVRAKVELLYHELQTEFEDLDPYRTGFVSQEDFKDLLMDLCIQLNEYECEVVGRKFDIAGDGRVSYLEFLKPFLSSRRVWRHGSNVAAVLHSHRDAGELPGEGSSTADRLRKKFRGKGRALRRAFRKLDGTDSGLLAPPQFSAALRLCGLALDTEETYGTLLQFGGARRPDGRLDYRRFLQEVYDRQPRRLSADARAVM